MEHHYFACTVFLALLEADYSPLRTATKSMPVFMSNVQCSDMDSSLLDCSYSRNISNTDHSKDLGVKCKKCKWIVCSISVLQIISIFLNAS